MFIERFLKEFVNPFISKIISFTAAIIIFMGAIAAWDGMMAKYAVAKDVRNNGRDIGGLIDLQKSIIKENQRDYIRQRLDRNEEKIFEIEQDYFKRNMPKRVRQYYDRLLRDKKTLEGRLR